MLTMTFPERKVIDDSNHDLAQRDEFQRSGLRRIQEVEYLIGTMVASWQSSSTVLSGRRWHHIRYTIPVTITPLDDRTEEPIGQPKLVRGRDISQGGVSFTHDHPLPFRKAALTFPLEEGSVASFVVRLNWCRFNRDGGYHSGCRFVRTIASPIGGDIDWSLLPQA